MSENEAMMEMFCAECGSVIKYGSTYRYNQADEPIHPSCWKAPTPIGRMP